MGFEIFDFSYGVEVDGMKTREHHKITNKDNYYPIRASPLHHSFCLLQPSFMRANVQPTESLCAHLSRHPPEMNNSDR